MRINGEPKNPFWEQIERAHRNLDRLTDREAEFIRDIHRRGEGAELSDKQARWLSGIMRKVS